MTNTTTRAERERIYAEAERLRQQGYSQQEIANYLSGRISIERARHAAAKIIRRSRKPR